MIWVGLNENNPPKFALGDGLFLGLLYIRIHQAKLYLWVMKRFKKHLENSADFTRLNRLT